MNILEVPLEQVNLAWPQCEAMLEKALDYSRGAYNVGDAKVFAVTGMWNLLVAVDSANTIRGAALVQYYNRPHDRVAFIIAMGGRLITNPDTFQQMSAILRSRGATALEGGCRPSVARLWERYGMVEMYRIVGVKL